MLIEQIIEFQLSLAAHVLLYLVYFMTKHESLRKIFEWIIIYCKNIAGDSVSYFPLHAPIHLQLKFYTIMQGFKRILDFNSK